MIYQNGNCCLNVNLSDIVGVPHQLIVCDRKHGMGWHLYVNGELESAEWYEVQHIPLSRLNVSNSTWFQSIPRNLQVKILRLDEANPELVFPLLCLVARYRSVEELFDDVPLLVLLLLVHAIRHKMRAEGVAALFTEKRTMLIQTLKLPASKSAWKLLGKLQCTSLDNRAWANIRQVFKHQHWQCLNHYTALDIQAIQCVNQNPR